MTELIIASITTFLGALVLTLGRLIEKLLIEPLKDFQNTRSEIMTVVTYYRGGRTLLNEDEKLKASLSLRMLASKYNIYPTLIPFYSLFASLKLLPHRYTVIQVSAALIGMSNSLSLTSPNSENVDKIIKLLDVPIHGEQFQSSDRTGKKFCNYSASRGRDGIKGFPSKAS